MLRQFVAVIILLGAVGSTSCAFGDKDNVMKIKSPKGEFMPELRTNIALVGAEHPVSTIRGEMKPSVLVDPSKLFDHVSEEYRKTDIEEDPEDRFITTRSGKLRVQLVDEAEDWADESPLHYANRSLVRKKRCGGGGGGDDDDDGNANRARRTRRSRRTRRNRVRRQRRRRRNQARRAARTLTTTITRTILPANQLATYQQTQTVVPAPAMVQVQQQPGAQVIQTVQTQPATVQTVHQQQPSQVQVVTQPQVQVQPQTVAAPAA